MALSGPDVSGEQRTEASHQRGLFHGRCHAAFGEQILEVGKRQSAAANAFERWTLFLQPSNASSNESAEDANENKKAADA